MGTRVHGHYHQWYSPAVGRTMGVRWFGHGGARVLAFPTTMGNHNEWPDRSMPDVLHEHIARGWVQLWCLDHNHDGTWYDRTVHPGERAWRHLQYDAYVVQELLPFVDHVNGNGFTIATGASFGAFHAMSIGLRNPERFHRIIGMSGMYDIKGMTEGYTDGNVHACNPADFIRFEHEPGRLAALQRQDIIMVVGRDDPHFAENQEFSGILWDRGIGNALREWHGFAHDWPWWENWIVRYLHGHD